jgi:hypothetical protein
VLTRRALPAYGPWSALLAGLTFLGLSIVRSEIGLVMAELPLTLLCLLAVLAFADFTASRRLGDALRFSGWASLAILTKGNALALGLLPPLAILLTGAFGLLRSPKLWLAALIIAVVCGPVYYLTLHMAIAVGSDKGYVSSGYLLRNLQTVLPQFLLVACPALLAAAAVGSVRCLAEPVGTGEGPRHALTLRVVLAWVAAVLIFHVVIPISGEPRYLLPALPGVVLLAWHGLDGLGRVFTGRAARLGWAIPMLGGGLILGGDARPLRPLVAGYRAAAASIPVTDEGTVVLVASNTHGEGAFIVERRLQDPSRTSYVLRASKVLASDSWTGACYRPRFETTAELRRYLAEVPVHYLLFDDFPCPEQRNTAHLDLLGRLLRESPDEFPLVGEFPVRGWWGMREGTARLYLNRQAQGRAPGAIHIDMRRMLNREIGTEASPPAAATSPARQGDPRTVTDTR